MSKVYVGNLDTRTTERDIEDKFRRYGKIRTVYIPRSSPNGGFAFVDFYDQRDADDAVRGMVNCKYGWRVEHAKPRRGERDYNTTSTVRADGCYTCGEMGHFARDCPRSRGGFGGGGRDYYGGGGRDERRRSYERDDRKYSRSPSRSPRRKRSYSRSKSRSPTRSRDRSRSHSPRRSPSKSQSPRSRSRSPVRERSRSASPYQQPYDGANGAAEMEADVPKSHDE